MTPTDRELESLARELGDALLERGASVTCAESCTGGWISKVLTDVPGSSSWFGWGFVTYANEAKQDELHVAEETLREHGAVSERGGGCDGAGCSGAVRRRIRHRRQWDSRAGRWDGGQTGRDGLDRVGWATGDSHRALPLRRRS